MVLLDKTRRVVLREKHYLCYMQRICAWILTLWYALMVSGIYLHVHYCCGRVLDISLNPTHAICSTEAPADRCGSAAAQADSALQQSCCTSSGCHKGEHPEPSGHAWSKSCCSSDDFYIAIEDAHDKSSFSLDFHLNNPPALPQKQHPVAPVKSPVTHSIDARAGPPLYLLFVSRIDYA